MQKRSYADADANADVCLKHHLSQARVQTSYFWSHFDIQSTGVTLQMRSRSPKLITSIPHLPIPVMCLCQFGQNPLIGSEDRVQKRSFADADANADVDTTSNMPPTSASVCWGHNEKYKDYEKPST